MPDRPYALRLKESAVRDLGRLDEVAAKRIRGALSCRLTADPRAGKPLVAVRDRESGRSLWSLRVGDYRVIYTFSDAEVWVLVVRIGHRGGVYRGL